MTNEFYFQLSSVELSPRCQDNALGDELTHVKFRKTGIDGSNKIRFPTVKTGE